MAISFAIRQAGEVGVVCCAGRIVMGTEATSLSEVVEEILPRTRKVLLQLAEIDFIDSAGLGLLIRLLRRIETSHGRLALCMLPPRLALALHKTNMLPMFEVHDSEDAAIAALHLPRVSDGNALGFVYSNVLCAVSSPDLVSYVSELLSQAGYGVLTATNIADAATLLGLLARPKLVVTSREFRTTSDPAFLRLLASAVVVDLPPSFSMASVDDSGPALLAVVRNAIGAPAP